MTNEEKKTFVNAYSFTYDRLLNAVNYYEKHVLNVNNPRLSLSNVSDNSLISWAYIIKQHLIREEEYVPYMNKDTLRCEVFIGKNYVQYIFDSEGKLYYMDTENIKGKVGDKIIFRPIAISPKDKQLFGFDIETTRMGRIHKVNPKNVAEKGL